MGSSVVQKVDLCIDDCPAQPGFVEQDTTLVTVASQLYEVILKAVLPYPTEGNAIAEKEAVPGIELQ